MWVRGLKHPASARPRFHRMSHPMWVRGLKHTVGKNDYIARRVAPYVGAWIETVGWLEDSERSRRRTLCGCVD